VSKALKTIYVKSLKEYFVSKASRTTLCQNLQRLFFVKIFKTILCQKLPRLFCSKVSNHAESKLKDYSVSKVHFKDYLSILCAGEQLLPDAPRVQGDPVPGRTLSRRPAMAPGGGFFMDTRGL
jgi:hypothetical protein